MLSDESASGGPGPALRAEAGSRMRRARENLGISPHQAARQLGVSVDDLRNWEAGSTFPGVPLLGEMVSFYRISADGLLAIHSEEQFLEDLHLSAYRSLDPGQQRSIRQMADVWRRGQDLN